MQSVPFSSIPPNVEMLSKLDTNLLARIFNVLAVEQIASLRGSCKQLYHLMPSVIVMQTPQAFAWDDNSDDMIFCMRSPTIKESLSQIKCVVRWKDQGILRKYEHVL